MNLLKEEIVDYNNNLRSLVASDIELVVFPSCLYLSLLNGSNYKIGGQDVSKYESGSYTGDVSANQLKSLGCSYCLVGHSERRNIFGEVDEDILIKLKNLQKVGITPVLCIGENDKSNRYQVLERQLAILSDCDLDNLIIAYEPVYSIGTGIVLENSDINDVIMWIKEYLFDNYNRDVPVLYGGSVNEKNIVILNNINSLDGFLVGGASLDVSKVSNILEVIDSGKDMG